MNKPEPTTPILTDEEMAGAWLEAEHFMECLEEIPLKDARKEVLLDQELYRDGDRTHDKFVAQAQAKKIWEWGNEPCPHHFRQKLELGISESVIPKRGCFKCWQELEKEGK